MSGIENENWNYNTQLPPTKAEVWVRVVEAVIRAGGNSSAETVTHADVIAEAYNQRFDHPGD